MLKAMTINTITQYIDDNLESFRIDIETLVTYSGYSRRYLQLLFREQIGMPLGKYIQLRRVSRAAVFLKLTTLSLVTISERLFYDSQQTFHREFKKNTGYTPNKYRKHKVWSFSNMTGLRIAKDYFPAPNVVFCDEHYVSVNTFNYNEFLPFTGKHSDLKWNNVKHLLSESTSQVYLSHLIKVNKIATNEINIQVSFWTKNKQGENNILIRKGWYAYFSFIGPINRYVLFINGVYMNVMSLYGLQKQEEYDIEIISNIEDRNDIYKFEYYLPIECSDTAPPKTALKKFLPKEGINDKK